MYDKEALAALVKENALKFGDFTLASGKKAHYYLDCRKVTLDGRGAHLIGHGILDLLQDEMPDAVGGMAIGADPMTGAVITASAERGAPIRGFIVRKEAKDHGTGQDVEGPVHEGDRVIIVEDTVTTGGSALKAVDKAIAHGLQVVGIVALIDRLEGGAEAFAARGLHLRTLLTVRDLGVEPVAAT